MKTTVNILLTEFAVLLLLVFAWCATSPTVTEEAFQRHMDSSAFASAMPDAADDEAEADAGEEDPFAFLDDMDDSEGAEEDPFAFLNDLDDEPTDDEEDPFAFLDDF